MVYCLWCRVSGFWFSICTIPISCPLFPITYFCTMEVNNELIDELAHLARLHFDDEEKEEIKKDLQKMIGFVDKLNELDLDSVEPLLHLSSEVNVLREDEVKGCISREDGFRNAPMHDGKFFKVPKVIKNPK